MPRPAPHTWHLSPDHCSIQRAEGTFALKYVRITPQEWQFFYALQSPQSEVLQVSAASSLSAGDSPLPGQPMARASTTQVLGRLGSASVGVIHVSLVDRPGQQIVLDIAFPGRSTPLWSLAPVQQLRALPHPGGFRYELSIPSTALPDIAWYGPATSYHVGQFALQGANEAAPDSEPICVRCIDPTEIVVIPLAQYLAWTQEHP
jgi:hypothetical protein